VFPNAKFYTNGSNFQNAIDQNSTSTCYFLAALSAIGEYPEILQNIILTDIKNAAHIFAIRVLIRGIPTDVFVDDYLFFDTDDKLYMAQPGPNNDLFPPLF